MVRQPFGRTAEPKLGLNKPSAISHGLGWLKLRGERLLDAVYYVGGEVQRSGVWTAKQLFPTPVSRDFPFVLGYEPNQKKTNSALRPRSPSKCLTNRSNKMLAYR
jgi:hypothetical protein